jgi:hypothetical protein
MTDTLNNKPPLLAPLGHNGTLLAPGVGADSTNPKDVTHFHKQHIDEPRRLRADTKKLFAEELVMCLQGVEAMDLGGERDTIFALHEAATQTSLPTSTVQANLVATMEHMEMMNVALADRDLPKDLTHALNDPSEGKQWGKAWANEKARWKEFDTFGKKMTIGEAKREGFEVRTSTTAFKRRVDEHGQVEDHRVRLCAQEFKHLGKWSGKKVYAPVARDESEKIIFAYSHQKGLHLLQFDCKSAFRHGRMPYKMALRMPVSEREHSSDGEEYVHELIGNIEGTLTGAQIWWAVISKKLIYIGFHQMRSDRAVFVLRRGKHMCMILTHVDDGVLAVTTVKFGEYVVDLLRKPLEEHMPITITGPKPLRVFTGTRITMNGDIMTLDGLNWIKARLIEFGYGDDNGEINYKLGITNPFTGEKIDPDSPVVDDVVAMQSQTGCQAYIMVKWRPDMQPLVLPAMQSRH